MIDKTKHIKVSFLTILILFSGCVSSDISTPINISGSGVVGGEYQGDTFEVDIDDLDMTIDNKYDTQETDVANESDDNYLETNYNELYNELEQELLNPNDIQKIIDEWKD